VDRVELVLRKYDGRPHRRVTGLLLGTDEFGTWVGTPRHSLIRYSYGWLRLQFTREDAVRLIPHDGWWIAMFLADPSRMDVYCDITAPAQHTASRITVIDLDIDLIRYRAGRRVIVDDEDEFEEHRHLFGYPDDVVAGATAAAADLRDALANAREPFGIHHQKWMTRMRNHRQPH
jgi:protein associated with RNAse G/E